jgi:hypothetical protein
MQEPVLPKLLQQTREKARKADPAPVPRPRISLKNEPLVVTRPGRPTIKFVDVGNKFMDPREEARRVAESKRRARIKAEKREGQKPKS